MKNVLRAGLTLAAATLVLTSLASAQVSDSGTITLNGNVSNYVQIRAGGAITLTGATGAGAGITNQVVKGGVLTAATVVNFGELGPTNVVTFVYADVPLRLRSNVAYTLSMSTPGFTNADAGALQGTDMGFGVLGAARDAGGGVATGTDTVNATNSYDPLSGTVVSDRYTYTRTLNDFTPAAVAADRVLVTGPRIMNAAVPTGNSNGLVVNTRFAVAPGFYTPSSFSVPVTFTISAP